MAEDGASGWPWTTGPVCEDRTYTTNVTYGGQAAERRGASRKVGGHGGHAPPSCFAGARGAPGASSLSPRFLRNTHHGLRITDSAFRTRSAPRARAARGGARAVRAEAFPAFATFFSPRRGPGAGGHALLVHGRKARSAKHLERPSVAAAGAWHYSTANIQRIISAICYFVLDETARKRYNPCALWGQNLRSGMCRRMVHD